MNIDRLTHLLNSIAERNDEVAFAEIYRYFLPGLTSFANSILKDEGHAEDIVELVFLNIWKNRKILPTVKNFSHYTYVAVKHAAINFIYRQKNVLTDELGDYSPVVFVNYETNKISQENLATINDAINSLPPRCKLIFRLIKEEQMKYAEVAQLLDISVKTVEAQMLTAMTRITKTLRVSLPEFSQFYKTRK